MEAHGCQLPKEEAGEWDSASGPERILTAVGFILAILAILVAITALPVGDAFLWLVALELKSVTPPKLGGSGGGSGVC